MNRNGIAYKIVDDGSRVEIWIGLNPSPTPAHESETFIIATGDTKEKAIDNAIMQLALTIASIKGESR